MLGNWWNRHNRWDKLAAIILLIPYGYLVIYALANNHASDPGGHHAPLFYFIFYGFFFYIIPYGFLALIGSAKRTLLGQEYFWWEKEQQAKLKNKYWRKPEPLDEPTSPYQPPDVLDIDKYLEEKKGNNN